MAGETYTERIVTCIHCGERLIERRQYGICPECLNCATLTEEEYGAFLHDIGLPIYWHDDLRAWLTHAEADRYRQRLHAAREVAG